MYTRIDKTNAHPYNDKWTNFGREEADCGLKILHKGFNFSQDGPGNRLVYHLQGCNFCCPWCSNPESIPTNGILMQTNSNQNPPEDCCPKGAIQGDHIDRNVCTSCLDHPCTSRCKELKFSCREYSSEEIINEIIAAKPMYFSGGGVTFTGGEPTFQAEPLLHILEEVHKHSIHTAIETNGSSPRFQDFLATLDLVIFDFKHHDDIKYSQIGGNGVVIKEHLKLLFNSGKPCIIRTPLIKWFNCAEGDAEKFAAFYSQFNTANAQFELLPYHEYGKDKWNQCGFNYAVKDSRIDKTILDSFTTAYRESGLKITKT